MFKFRNVPAEIYSLVPLPVNVNQVDSNSSFLDNTLGVGAIPHPAA
jgi:hypothetical protein